MGLTEFVAARIAEDEAYLNSNRRHLWTQRPLREVEAKRTLLRYFTNPEGDPVSIGIADTPEQLGRGNVTALPGSWVLRALAAVYEDHKDYDPAWKD